MPIPSINPPAVRSVYTHEDGTKLVHPLTDEMCMGQVAFGPPDENRNADIQVNDTFELIFDEGGIAPHEVVCTVLRGISSQVKTILNNLSKTPGL